MMRNLKGKTRKGTALLLLFFSLFFSGCAEVKEINDMAIVSGISVDLSSEGLWKVSAEVVNKRSESSPEETRQVISAEGDTLGDALEKLNFQDSRQIYYSHAKTLVISKKLAETKGVGAIADYVIRNYKTRLSLDLIISDLADASEVADLSSSSSGLIYYDLEEMVKTDHQYGACSPTKVYQAVNILEQNGTELTIPLVQNQEDRAVLSGTAVFRGDRMIDALSSEETLYLLMLQDHLKTAHLTLPEEDMTFQIRTGKTDFRASRQKDGAYLNIDLHFVCSLTQASGSVGIDDTKGLAEKLSRSVETRCEALVRKAQKWDADIFGFSKSMEDIPYRFNTLPVRIRCTVDLELGEVR